MTTTTKLTIEEFLCLPETKPASEFVDGEVIQKPMPDRKHSRLQVFLYVTHGVRITWVVDPERRSISEYAPRREPRYLTIEATLDGGDVLPGFSVPVERIFARIAVCSLSAELCR